MVQLLPVTPEPRFVGRVAGRRQLCQHGFPVFGEGPLHPDRVGGPQGRKVDRDLKMRDQRPQLLQLFQLTCRCPIARLNILIQRGGRIDGEHGGADEPGMGLVEDLRAFQGAPGALARARQPGQIHEIIADASPVQPPGLLHDVFGLIALVHERQGLAVSRLHAYAEAVVAQAAQLLQFAVGLQRHIRHPGKAADGPAGGKVAPDQLRNGLQTVKAQDERVGTHQIDPADRRPRRQALEPGGQLFHGVAEQHLGLPQVLLHLLQRRHAELKREVVIQRAEFAFVIGAARRDLQQQGAGLIGRPPDGACVVHMISPLIAF